MHNHYIGKKQLKKHFWARRDIQFPFDQNIYIFEGFSKNKDTNQ